MLCKYGCGQEAKYQLKNGKWCCSKNHRSCIKLMNQRSQTNKERHLTKRNSKVLIKPDLCEYGCGNPAVYFFKTSKKWCCSYHHTKCPVFRNNKSEATKGKCYLSKNFIEEQRQRMLNGQSNYMNSIPRNSEKEYIRRKNQRQRMLDGQASYMNSFIKNPSKPQVELYNRIKTLYPSAILNFHLSSLNFSLDVAIPDLKIYFESDGSWWHKDKEKDLERQIKIELFGWKLIRYYPVDNIKQVPSIDQIKKNIDNLR